MWLQRSTAMMLAALMAVGWCSAAKLSPGCGNAPKLVTPNASKTPLTINSGGTSRQYFVRLPANYDKNHAYRLIFTLHALGTNAQQVVQGQAGFLPWYGLPALINDTTDAIYVAPNGLDNGWANTNDRDVTFIRAVATAVEADVCVDQNLRFSTGFSYGAAMSFVLACRLGAELRAVAVLSGSPQISGTCGSGSAAPVAYYGEHGVHDSVLPIAGGHQMRDHFAQANGCSGPQSPPEPARGSGKHVKTQYQGCKPGYPVTWVAFDGDHTPQPMDAGAKTTFAAQETWEFFSQFT